MKALPARLREGMRDKRRLRWVLLVLGAAALCLIAVIVALPFIASTQLVRDRIAAQMSLWSGYNVEVGERPEVEVWPRFRAVLKDVSFSASEGGGQLPVIEADRIEINLSALAALRGRTSFDRMRLIRPVLRVSPSQEALYLPAMPLRGKMVESVEDARSAVRADPRQPDLGLLPSDPLGVIEVAEGRLVRLEDGRETEIMTGIEGRLDWPQLNRAASLSGYGIWRGQRVSVELRSGQPLLHVAGGTASFLLAIRSQPFNLRFEGSLGTARDAFVEGTLQLSAPSLSGAMAWLRRGYGGQVTEGPFEFSGQLTGTPGRLRFDNAALALDTISGLGGFELSLAETVPTVSGTMAFDLIDLQTVGTALAPFLPALTSPRQPASPGLLSALNLDLRISASRATSGPIVLNEMAATAQVRPGIAVFDISDATVFGGTIQAGIRADRSPGADRIELRLDARDIDGGAAGDALGLRSLLPVARGNVSIAVGGMGDRWQTILENADGTVKARFGSGTLRGVDPALFTSRLAQGGFFPLDEVAAGSLPFQNATMEAVLADGVARLSQATIRTQDRTITLQGIIPYQGGLALTGAIEAANPGTPPAPASRFFVGGSWQAPFVAPVPSVTPPG